MNPSLRASEIGFVLQDARVQALIAGGEGSETAIAVARESGIRVFAAARTGEKAGDWTISSAPGAFEPSRDDPPRPDDVALHLHTSGTTARAKLVPILHSSIAASAHSIVDSLRLTPRDCGLCVMPLFHVHGLVAGLLAPLAAGGRVWCAPGFQADQFFTWLQQAQATWFTAVPTMHQVILLRSQRQPDGLRSHKLRLIRSCSAPLPEAVWTGLRKTFGVPVVQAYGMTEAAHQISCTSLNNRPSETGSVGRSTGPDIAIVDQQGILQPTGTRGEVVLKGASIVGAYESPPEANHAAFRNGWFRTGDEGYLDHAGNLRLTGRLKELINSGGEKISPYEIEEALLSHPAVQEAVTFSMPHALLGEAVAAAIVPKSTAEVSGPALRSWLRSRLAPHKLPKRIEVVDSLPRGSTGKLQRIGMASRLGLSGA